MRVKYYKRNDSNSYQEEIKADGHVYGIEFDVGHNEKIVARVLDGHLYLETVNGTLVIRPTGGQNVIKVGVE